MKVSATSSDDVPRVYPYFGKGKTSGLVVLFTGPRTGVVVVPNDSSFKAGYGCADWDEDFFDVFYGTITVSP